MIKKVARFLLPIVGGSIIGKLTTGNAKEDYEKYKQPPYAPPREAFGIVWPLLYATMGIAHNIVKSTKGEDEDTSVYYVQLGLNYLWSLMYFKYKLRGSALIESYCLLTAVILTAHSFYKKNKMAGLILLPYVCWTAFATYINAGTWLLNKDTPGFSNE